jgi:N-acetyl-gamma-glutamyl-phosphate reductase
VVSQSYAGKPYSDIYPSLRGIADMPCSDLDTDALASACDVVVTALPHGVSSEVVPVLLDKGLRVLDHSGDFRYKNKEIYEKAYNLNHPAPELLSESVYGLPEFYRDEISEARLVANPGCYPTCSLLALIPLLKRGLADPSSIIISAVSGVTGAGRKADIAYNFCEASENFRAYSVSQHRHTSEIEEVISRKAGTEVILTFTPHLAPMMRGMLATIYVGIPAGTEPEELRNAFETDYGNEFFVRFLPEGALPETKSVTNSNFADISLFFDKHTRRATILSAIDNLGKGASLQAVQALNIMFGFSESEGLI